MQIARHQKPAPTLRPGHGSGGRPPRPTVVAAAVCALLGGAASAWADCTAVPSGATPDATTGILQPGGSDTVTCSGTSTVSVSNPAATGVAVNFSGSFTPPTFTATTVFSRPAVSLGQGVNITNVGTITLGHPIATNEGAITLRGAGSSVVNNGTISVTGSSAIQGALSGERSTGAVVLNTGTIAVDSPGNAAVGLGESAQITNSGRIELSSQLASSGNRALEVGVNSRVQNQASGLIRAIEAPGSATTAAVALNTITLGAGSTLVNAGLIDLVGDVSGTARGRAVSILGSQNQGGRAAIENTGVIDGSRARLAIGGFGPATIVNAGTIRGAAGGAAIDLGGAEGSELVLRDASQIVGSVTVRRQDTVPLGDAELGNSPSAIEFCRQNPTNFICTKAINALPNRATLTLLGAVGAEDDRLSGFNRIERLGPGTWTLSTPLQAGSASDGYQSGDFRGPLSVAVPDAAGRLNLAGAITDASDGTRAEIVKDGAGLLALSGNNTYSGPTRINAGVLLANGGNAIGDSSAVTVAAGATLAVGGSETIGSLGGAGNVLLQNNALTTGNDNTSTTFSGSIVDGGGLFKIGTGTLSLAGNSPSNGVLVVSGGTLDMAGTTAMRAGIAPAATLAGAGTVGNLVNEGRVVPGGPAGSALTVTGGYRQTPTGLLVINAAETSGSGLTATRLDVAGAADFARGAVVDVIFAANATIPALQGIRILNAEGGLSGTAPAVTLDPASLPNGQNFTLDLEATNLGGTFAKPGEAIPAGAGGAGTVVLQIRNNVPTQQVITAQHVAINGNYAVPPTPVMIAPPQVPQLVPSPVPNAVPVLAPALVKGPTSNVVTAVVAPQPGQATQQTGIVVQNHGVQIGGGTVTPTASGNVPVGTANSVVKVIPPTNLGTSNFISVTGSYATVDQTNALPGATFRLGYAPHEVTIYKTPSNYGNLVPLGTNLTATQRQVGNALTSMLPDPQARASTAEQAALVAALYPLGVSQIPAALDSVAGEGSDPTFVTAMNSRLFQQAIEGRLQEHRDGAPLAQAAPADRVVGRTAWGIVLGGFGSGDYLQDADLRTGGIVLGADRDLGRGWVAGGAIGYVRTSADPGRGGTARVASLEAAGYANWSDGAWFANGMAGLGHHWLDIDRRVAVGGVRQTASSSPEASGVFLAATAGRRFDLGRGLALEPLLGLRYDHVWRDGFKESGAAFANRSVDAESVGAAQVFAGLRTYADLELADGMRLRPEFSAGYAREIGDTDIVSSASLRAAPGSTFQVVTEGPGDNVAIVGARISGARGALAFFLDYRAEIRSAYTGHVARASVSFAF